MNLPDHMLAWLTVDEFARLAIAHEDVRMLRSAPREEPDAEANLPTLPAESA